MKTTPALTLLETMLSLAILSLTSSCLLTLYFFLSHNQKHKINEQKFHKIRVAMQSYLLQHGKLPTASKSKDGISAPMLISGYVPYKTLGIPKAYMYDANNKEFKYVVNKLFINTNIPLHVPLTYKPQNNEQSFLRLYTYQNGKLYYDNTAGNTLTIFDKNKISVISNEDYFFVLAPLKAPFNNINSFETWVKQTIQNEKQEYKVTNVVAWLIISFGKNNQSEEQKQNRLSEDTFYISSKNTGFYDWIFYQSRFDLAAQIGFYCTPEPIYDTNI